jgi:CubicO group peptidase (beta-lactamase class C family)
MNRRAFLASSVARLAPHLWAVPELEPISSTERDAIAAVAARFLNKHDVLGLSVAISVDDQLVYAEGFGYANKATKEDVTPQHLFRIASISKSLTSVTIMRLFEEGVIRLSDRVFGPEGILRTDYGTPPYNQYVEDVTVDYLLTHTAGGWGNDSHDPAFQHLKMDRHDLIAWGIRERPLEHSPGMHFEYSNFGYLILGRVIEKLTSQPYETAVQQYVLKRCGIRNMIIAGNTPADRLSNEAVYYAPHLRLHGNPYNLNIHRLDAAGGWVATPTDLVKFMVSVDGLQIEPDILQPETIRLMTTPSALNSGYAKGWDVEREHVFGHFGGLPGTVSEIRRHDRYCWAVLANTSNREAARDLGYVAPNMLHKVRAWLA